MDSDWIQRLRGIDETVINRFTNLCTSIYEEIKNLHIQKKKLVIEEREIWNKKVEKTRQEMINLERKSIDVDLEETMLVTKLKSLKSEVEETDRNIVFLKEELSELSIEKERREKVFEETKEKGVKTYQALIAAMSFYKLNIKCYIYVDSSDSSTFSFYYFYDMNKSLEEHNYYITLNYCGGQWDVLHINCSVSCKEEIIAYLKETEDIIGFISHLYYVYSKNMKTT